MKKIILFAAFAVVAFATQAQVKFGVQAGINGASAKQEFTSGSSTNTQKFDTKIGLTIGAVAELPIASSFYFRPELNFTQKGGKYSDSETLGGVTYKYENKVTLNYLELPLNFVYKLDAGSGKILLGAGPSIGFGISGKSNEKETAGGTTDEVKTDIKFDGKKDATDDNYHLKSLDFGANALVGYEMTNNLVFKAGYSIGLSNISPEDNTKFKNKGFNVTIGYNFGAKSSNN